MSATAPSTTRTEAFLPRVVAGAGSLMLFVSLFATWGFDYTVQPPPGLNAFELLSRTDVLFTVGAVAALAGAVLPRRRLGAALSAAAGLGALALVIKVYSADDPARGPRYAALAALILLAGALTELAPDPWKRRVRTGWHRGGDGLRRVGIPVPEPGAAPGGWRELGRWSWARVWPVVVSTPVLAALVWLAAAPLVPLAPGGGTDGSWITALHLAHQRGLDFGTEILYTYGPLGYLTVPRAYDPTQLRMGWAYNALVYYALAFATIAAGRRTFPPLVAAVVAMLTLECFRIISPDEQTQFAVLTIAFIAAVALIRGREQRERRWWLPVLAVAGAIAGLESLMKLNSGLTMVLVLGLATLAAGPLRRPYGPLAFAGGFVVGLLAGWVAAGQSLGALDDYIKGSFEIITGYPEYAYTEGSGRAWEYLAAAGIIPMLLWIAWVQSAGWAVRARAVLITITALILYSTFKQGFVRHDAHSLQFFATTIGVAIALGWHSRPHFPGWMAVGICLLGFVAAAQPVLYEFHRPRGTYNFVRETLRTLENPQPLEDVSLEQTRAKQNIPPEALRLIGDRPVHFMPSEASVAWSQPQLNWRSLPVFQGFLSYTDYLTDLNADLLRSDRAPEMILRTAENSAFEDPEAVMEVACRYVEIFAQGDWQVLERVPNRCGAPRLVQRVETSTDRPLAVPPVAPNELLYFRVHGWEPPLAEKVKSLLWKPYDRHVLFDGEVGGRLAPSLGAARNLLVVGDAAEYSPEFPIGFKPRELTFRMTTHGIAAPVKQIHRDIEVEFYTVPVAGPGRR